MNEPRPMTSWPPGICKLDGQAVLVILWRVCFQAGEALARRIYDEEVAVRAVVPAQAYVSRNRLIVCSIELDQSRESQEPRE